MNRPVSILVLSAAGFFSAASFADRATDDLAAKLQGNWTLIAAHDGTENNPVDGIRMWVDGDRMGLGKGKDFDVGTLKLDASKSPVEFDGEPRQNPFGAERQLPPAIHGICKLEGDDFTMAFAPEGDRPTDFDLADKKLVMVFRRKSSTTRPTTVPTTRVTEHRP